MVRVSFPCCLYCSIFRIMKGQKYQTCRGSYWWHMIIIWFIYRRNRPEILREGVIFSPAVPLPSVQILIALNSTQKGAQERQNHVHVNHHASKILFSVLCTPMFVSSISLSKPKTLRSNILNLSPITQLITTTATQATTCKIMTPITT
jgi:hypothetical protein